MLVQAINSAGASPSAQTSAIITPAPSSLIRLTAASYAPTGGFSFTNTFSNIDLSNGGAVVTGTFYFTYYNMVSQLVSTPIIPLTQTSFGSSNLIVNSNTIAFYMALSDTSSYVLAGSYTVQLTFSNYNGTYTYNVAKGQPINTGL